MQGHAIKTMQRYVEIPLYRKGVSRLMKRARRSEEGLVSLEDLKDLSQRTFGEEIFSIILTDRSNILRKMQRFQARNKLVEYYILSFAGGEYLLYDRVEEKV